MLINSALGCKLDVLKRLTIHTLALTPTQKNATHKKIETISLFVLV